MAKKIGRNDKCFCGSGLKYKMCCLNRKRVNHIYLEKIQQRINEVRTLNRLKHIAKTKKVMCEDESGYYRGFWNDNIEKVNPVQYFQDLQLKSRIVLYRDLLETKYPVATKLSDDFFLRFAQEKIKDERFWENMEQIKVPENLLKLFEVKRKKEQEALLKGISITTEQLLPFIFKSYKDYGFLFSRYRFEILPKDIEDKKKPTFANIQEDGRIEVIGETDLSKGQVKNMIEQRKVIVANFFDKGKDWHCLFLTYNSIGGKENWQNGQPHYHYISSLFGISRENFIQSMKDGQYKSTSVHIGLLNYRQPINTEKNSD